MSKYPSTICYDCGIQHGRRKPGEATWYPETCDICGEKTDCTQPRDFGHLKPGWEQAIKDSLTTEGGGECQSSNS